MKHILISCCSPQTGWPEKWVTGVDWELNSNDCRNCEATDSCGDHHQSPIALERRWGYNNTDGSVNCEDWHAMKYADGTCTFDHLKAANAFTVERHSLRMAQPLEKIDGNYRLNCLTQGRGRLFSRVDFSKGFINWWFLNHLEIKTPSEHVQEGKRYDAEVQMGLFYSVSAEENANIANQMGTIAIFLQAYNDSAPYPYLDKLICQWRHSEEKTRNDCSYASASPYPGCFYYNRTANETTSVNTGRRTRNIRKMVIDNDGSSEEATLPLEIDPENFRDHDLTEEDWAEFQEDYSRQHPLGSHNTFSNGERHLIDYDHVPHSNFQFLLDSRTEYYYRYQGTMTIPPCFGLHTPGTRANTNHWRIMKDPIRVHPRQIAELHRLLKERIAPDICIPDTAANVSDDGSAWVARPLQARNEKHDNTFCECENWGSQIPEDKAWCQSGDQPYRWYERPYNFDGTEF